MPIDVSVLVPILDEAAHLDEAVPAMLGQRFDGEIEYLLIDGGSSDGSRGVITALAAADARVRLLDNPSRNTPAALNLGLRAASGTYVARMDAHAVYPPDYLARGVRRLERDDVGSVSGPQVAVAQDGWARVVALALSTALGVGDATFRRVAPVEHEVASGFTGLWRRDVLLACGGWDEHAVGDEDTELAARLRTSGRRIVCVPEMAAVYRPRSDLRRLGQQYWRYGRARVRTWRRHPGSLRPSQLLPAGLVLTLAASTFPVPIARPLARLGTAAYGTAVLTTVVATARSGGRHAAGLTVVLPVMHVCYGLGFLRGLLSLVQRTSQADGHRREGVRLLAFEDSVYTADESGLSTDQAFLAFLSGLAAEDCELTLAGRLHPVPGRSHYRLPAEVAFVALPYYASLSSASALPALVASVHRVWKALDDVDVVWLLGPHPFAILVAGLAALRRTPVVLGVRQDLPDYVRRRRPGRPLLRVGAEGLEVLWRVLARGRSVVAVGPALADRYACSPRVLELEVSLVPLAELDAVVQRTAGPCERTLLSVGRLDEEKNPLLLADVLALLREQDARWRLVVCGDGPLLGTLRARLEARGLAEFAELRGYVPVDRGLLDIYRSCDVLLHVSWTEGMPQVLVEAWAAGIPVVATDVGGVGRASAGAACLIPPGDAAAAVTAVLRLERDAALAARLVASGRLLAMERSQERTLARLRGFLQQPEAVTRRPSAGV